MDKKKLEETLAEIFNDIEKKGLPAPYLIIGTNDPEKKNSAYAILRKDLGEDEIDNIALAITNVIHTTPLLAMLLAKHMEKLVTQEESENPAPFFFDPTRHPKS